MEHEYSGLEFVAGLIGVLLTLAFAAWAAVVKKAADDMGDSINRAISELAQLREEIHKDRLHYEQRLSRLEIVTGVIDAKSGS